ncbi:hypothetical protein BKA70DRAFT_1276591, partial [Coprinopsis sp. MPI-PUGE-AT-0042]
RALRFTSPYGVTTTPALVALLKSVALTSHHLCRRAQRHLFMNIRLHPFPRNRRTDAQYQPSILDEFMSIFKANPRLLQYPRLLAITTENRSTATTIERPAIEWGNWHFLTVRLSILRQQPAETGACILASGSGARMEKPPLYVPRCHNHCLQGNELKSFSLKHLSLPRDFVRVLPSTLNACSIGVAVDDDPDFACKHIRTPNNGRQQTTCEPNGSAAEGKPTWAHKQEDAFFEQISYLQLGIGDLSAFESIMDHSFRHMPHLEELRVIVSRRDYWQIAFSFPVSNSGGRPRCGMHTHPSRIFRLVIKWRVHPSSLLREGEGSSERFLQRSPDGFACLDDQLSDERKFNSLEHVELSFEPRLTDTTPLLQEVARVHKDHLRKEAMETLTVVTCNAFGCEA